MEKEKSILSTLNIEEEKKKEESESLQRLRSQILAKKELEQKLMEKSQVQARPSSSIYDELAKKAKILEDQLEGVKEEKEEVESVASSNQELISKIENLEELVERLEQKNAQLEEKAQSFSEERIEGLKKEHEKEIAMLQDKLDEALLSTANNPETHESLKEFIKAVEAKAKAQEKKVLKQSDKTVLGLKSKLDKVKENMTTVKSELTKANMALKKNEAKNAKLIEDLKSKLELANKEIEALKSNLKNTRVSVLDKVKDKDIEIMREKLEDEKRNVSLLREKLEMEQSYLKLFKQEIEEKYSDEIRSLKGKIAYLEKQPEKFIEVESEDSIKLASDLEQTLERLASQAKKNALLEEQISILNNTPSLDPILLEEKDAKINELMQELEDVKESSRLALEESDKKVEEISLKFHELVAFLEEHKDALNDSAEVSTLEEELQKELLVEKELYKLIEEKDEEIKRLKEEQSNQKYNPYPPFMFAFPPQMPSNNYELERELHKKDDYMSDMQKKYEEQILALQKRVSELESLVSDLKKELASKEEMTKNSICREEPILEYPEDIVPPEYFEPEEPIEKHLEELMDEQVEEPIEEEPIIEYENGGIERLEEPQSNVYSNDYLNRLNNIYRERDMLNMHLNELEEQKKYELEENYRLQKDFASKCDSLNSKIVSLTSNHDLAQDGLSEEEYQKQLDALYKEYDANNSLYQKLAIDGVAKINIKYANSMNEIKQNLASLAHEEAQIASESDRRVILDNEPKKEDKPEIVKEEELSKESLEQELESGICPFPSMEKLEELREKNLKAYDELAQEKECQTYIKSLEKKEECQKKLAELESEVDKELDDDLRNSLLNEISALTKNIEKIDSFIDDLEVNEKVKQFLGVAKKIDDINKMIKA